MKPEPAGPLLAQFLATIDRTPRNTVNFVVELNARVQQRVGYIVRLETGVYEPEETLATAQGSCRDSSWLLVAGAAPSRLRRALRLRLPDPAQARPRLARRAAGHRPRLHRPSRLVRGVPARRRLDRPRSDLGPADRRKPHPARRDAALSQRRADLGASAHGCANVDFGFDMKVTRVAEHPRITKPFSDESWARLNALGQKVDAVLQAERRAPHHGRRADLRVDRRFREPASGTPTPSAPPSAAKADDLIRRLRDTLRARRLPALWPGQMVSRRNPAALDLLALLARATASRSGATQS